MDGVDVSSSLLELTESAIDANKAHQYALTRHAERLTAELQELDKLMSAVTTKDIEDESDDVEIQVPGAIKPLGPCSVAEFLNPNSPFYYHASRRSKYLADTVDHPMKTKELDALAEAVRQENLRLKAYAAQQNRQSEIELDIENNTEGINWSVVAENVSKASGSISRTADQCRIKWLGDRHPKINYGNWSPSELEKLKDLVSAQTQSNQGKVDWVQIASELGTNRTPLDCMRRGVVRQRHVWNADADQRLADAVKLYGTYNWNIVARYVSEDATAAQCQVRYSRAIDPSRKRGAWTDDEFTRLKAAVAAYGHSWVDVATCIPGRSNEQCRDRWTEHLGLASANIVWSEADDQTLEATVVEIGTRWKDVSARVGNGTTGQQCRTRWEKLKRLKDQRQAAADTSSASPSTPISEILTPTPKPIKGRPRKAITSAGISTDQGQYDIVMTESPEVLDMRSTKKGKGKEKAIIHGTTTTPVGNPTSGSSKKYGTASVGAKKRVITGTDDNIEVPAKKKRKIDESSVPLPVPPRRGRPRGKTNQPSALAESAEGKDGNTTATSIPDLATPLRPRPKPRPRGRKKTADLNTEEGTSNITTDTPITPVVEASQPRESGVAPEPDNPAKEEGHSDPEVIVKAPRGRGRGRPRGRGGRGGRAEVTAVATHGQRKEDVRDTANTLNGERALFRESTAPETQISKEQGNHDERMAVDDEV